MEEGMKRFSKLFWLTFVSFLTIGSLHLFAQESKTLDGVKYTVITPATYAFNADSGSLKVGQKYVIEGSVLNVTGATLNLNDAGILNSFKLNSPLKLDFGTKVTIYVELTSVTSFSTEAKIVKIDGAGISANSGNTNAGSRTLDGKNYNIIAPNTYAFNAESGKIKTGERYVLDGSILSISGATLNLNDAGILNSFKLNEPSSLKFGAKVRIYVEVTTVTSFSTEAKIIKMENL